MRKIGILGGTFDPIHSGHITLAKEIMEHEKLQEIIFVPCKIPPHKTGEPITDEKHRFAMTEIAIADYPRFSVSDVELHLQGPSYTVRTLSLMQQKMGNDIQLHFIIGADSVFTIETWYEAEKLLSQFFFIAGGRPGYREEELLLKAKLLNSRYENHISICPISLTDVSSTEIRELVRQKKSIEGMVPMAVKQYIEEHGLYEKETDEKRNGERKERQHNSGSKKNT